MTEDEVLGLLCAPGAPFEMETVTAHGRTFRAWKNAPADLAMLARIGRSHGTREFLVYEDDRVTYAGWFRAVAALAAHLRGAGVGHGDRVAIAMRNLPEWPVAFFAVTVLGAIAVPLNAWWTGAELAYGVATAGCKVVIADPERLDRLTATAGALDGVDQVLAVRCEHLPAGALALESVIGTPSAYATLPDAALPPADLAPDDEATIFYTSGTTGHPKGALGTHRNLVTNILSSAWLATSAVNLPETSRGPATFR